MTETTSSDYDVPPGLTPAQQALWVLMARKFDEHFSSVFENLAGAA